MGWTMTSSVLLILVVGRTMAPDNAHILIPTTCEYIAKRTLQMGCTWRWKSTMDDPDGSNVLTGSLSMKEEGRRVSVRLSPATAGFEDEARGPWPRNAGGLEAGKGQGTLLP